MRFLAEKLANLSISHLKITQALLSRGLGTYRVCEKASFKAHADVSSVEPEVSILA